VAFIKSVISFQKYVETSCAYCIKCAAALAISYSEGKEEKSLSKSVSFTFVFGAFQFLQNLSYS